VFWRPKAACCAGRPLAVPARRAPYQLKSSRKALGCQPERPACASLAARAAVNRLADWKGLHPDAGAFGWEPDNE